MEAKVKLWKKAKVAQWHLLVISKPHSSFLFCSLMPSLNKLTTKSRIARCKNRSKHLLQLFCRQRRKQKPLIFHMQRNQHLVFRSAEAAYKKGGGLMEEEVYLAYWNW